MKCEEKLQSLSAIGEQLQTQLVAKLESFNKNQDQIHDKLSRAVTGSSKKTDANKVA